MAIMSDNATTLGAFHAQPHSTSLRSFYWRDVEFTGKDRKSQKPKTILKHVSGVVHAGHFWLSWGLHHAIEYPGTSNLVHGRSISRLVYSNGASPAPDTIRQISTYVEQEEALVGSLTVRGTLELAARLALPKTFGKMERIQRIDSLLAAFDLEEQADALIGTPIRKGISGGQKRRVSVASQLITNAKLLFLDEPTSGLDSAASFDIISYIKRIAKKHGLIVIASIHQPSTSTFSAFDRLLLLSQGRVVYSGPKSEVQTYFHSIGNPLPHYMNPAEFIMDYIKANSTYQSIIKDQLKLVHQTWLDSHQRAEIEEVIERVMASKTICQDVSRGYQDQRSNNFTVLLAQVHRSFTKSHRDIVAYGIRIVMYMGLAVMMGTIWLRLSPGQDNIPSSVNPIFFGGAFMSFMAVAYIPVFLEDRALFMRERANGLYGSTSFMIAHLLTGIPYLLIIAVLVSIIAYWLSNSRPTASGFFAWVMWLFLDLVAAESLVVLIAALVPNFVVALAAAAFTNGIWTCTGGFLVTTATLNPFWRYAFHYINYQRMCSRVRW
ncbi:hypothetical protein LTR95_002254 [Oleoguttula sp. CCFEE 5521]